MMREGRLQRIEQMRSDIRVHLSVFEPNVQKHFPTDKDRQTDRYVHTYVCTYKHTYLSGCVVAFYWSPVNATHRYHGQCATKICVCASVAVVENT